MAQFSANPYSLQYIGQFNLAKAKYVGWIVT